MSVTCNNCGHTWPRDPALEVPCPVCNAKIGCKCTINRPSEHKLNPNFVLDKNMPGGFHPERDLLAMEKVPGYGKCPGKKKK